MARYIYLVVMIVAAALSRLLPHPANVTPVTAMALFGAVYLDRRSAFLVPIAAMLLSDIFLGFHSTMLWVYGSFAAMVFIGFWLRNHQGITSTVGASLVGSVIFYLVTNLGVWVSGMNMYPPTMAGLGECYVAAIPFFRNSLIGDLAYTAVLFGGFALSCRMVPLLNKARTSNGLAA